MKTHLGVYGVQIEHDKLLCIIKNRGPYIHRLDLPGGSMQQHESMIDALKRELLEETGHQVISYENFGTFDFFIRPIDEVETIHHIAIIFLVYVQKATPHITSHVSDGLSDSIGVRWVDLSMIDKDNSSPLVYKIKSIFVDQCLDFNAEIYSMWEVYTHGKNDS